MGPTLATPLCLLGRLNPHLFKAKNNASNSGCFRLTSSTALSSKGLVTSMPDCCSANPSRTAGIVTTRLSFEKIRIYIPIAS